MSDRRGDLDSQVEQVIGLIEDYDIALSDFSVEEAREMMENMSGMAQGDPVEVDSVRDREIETEEGDLDVRIYEYDEPSETPCLVFYHGGGFVVGSLDTHDNLCRMLCNEAESTVVSVDYRLAPENPFPAAAKDAYNALNWVSGHSDKLSIDPGSIGVVGDSAGGNLSAVTSLIARDRGMPDIAFQGLLYPATAYMDNMPSRAENAEGYFLTLDDLLWFADKYIQDDFDARHPYAFPLQAKHLGDLPPALVITCGFDPLRDEGYAYADRLEQDGTDVVHSNYPGMIHGFLNMEGLVDKAGEAVTEIAENFQRHI